MHLRLSVSRKAWRRVAWEVALLLVVPVLILGCAVSQPILGKGPASSATVDPESLSGHVVTIAQRFSPRSFADEENLAACADYIAAQFAETGGQVTRQPYSVYGRTYENVILTLPGADDARVIVGAHYDACDDTPGADDNASGVAGLIGLGRLLGRAKLQHTVELVAYCTEEPPFFATDHMGSAHHAGELRRQDVTVRAMIALEMIGYFSDERGSQAYPVRIFRLFYPSRGNFIAVIGNTKQRSLIREVKRSMRGATELPVRSACVPVSLPGVDFSDHRNYWAKGYPAVMVTDTAFFRNKDYHRPGDTAERLDYDRMADVVVGVFEAVKVLSETAQP
jgi:hypothetical protein